MPRSIEDVVAELLEDADDGSLDPLRGVYVERQGETVDYIQADESEGWHMRSTIGAVRRRVLADGTVRETFTEPDECAPPDAWLYLPAPIGWPGSDRAGLGRWLIGLLAVGL